MVRRPFLALAFAAPMLVVLAGPAWCQATTAAASSTLGPAPSTAPDPLTPPEVVKPPPAAPGVPTSPAETARPASEQDAIVALVRQRLAGTGPARRSAGDRDDHAGLVAFYAEHAGEAVWTGKSGFTTRGQQALAEIRKADDWGLKASAFDLPSLPQGPGLHRGAGGSGDQARPRRPQVRPACTRRTRGPAVGPPHLRPEAHHLRSQDPDAGARRLELGRRLPARPASPGTRNSSACARPCWPRARPSPTTPRPPPPGRPRTSSA